MIPLSETRVQPESWQQQLSRAVTDPLELCRRLSIDPADLLGNPGQLTGFKLKVTEDFISRMTPGNVNDPLLRQVLPVTGEMVAADGFITDPVGDLDATASPGLIHKYAGRVLLVTTPACAVHCRYCFRRHYPYQDASAHGHYLDEALASIRQQADIQEVILSGGDPLMLSDPVLERLIGQLEDIAHVTTLRLHSRLPIVLPSRITPGLLERLERSRLRVVLVVHANHPQEICATVQQALLKTARAGITLLNQSVLLAGINDHAETLCQLSHSLFSCQALPYYLHLLDPVAGAAHFAVDEARARRLHGQMRSQLPGYLLPRLVREVPGAEAKSPVG